MRQLTAREAPMQRLSFVRIQVMTESGKAGNGASRLRSFSSWETRECLVQRASEECGSLPD